jgi:hypothetical protein
MRMRKLAFAAAALAIAAAHGIYGGIGSLEPVRN